VGSGLALRISAAAAVLVTAITVVLFLPDNLILQFDQYVASFNHYLRLSELSAIAQVVDDLGRREVILPVMLLVLGLASLRMRSWWPVFLGSAAFLMASVIVGILKFVTQRTSPRLGPGDFGLPDLVDTIGLYPSGHAANAAVAWGAMVYFSAIAWGWSKRVVLYATAGALLVVVLVGVISAYLQYHWVSDLISGALVGVAALFLVIAWYERRAPAAFATRAPVERLDLSTR
jgi:undecaprenyl-diphosphatase